jgi:hypothetical protein
MLGISAITCLLRKAYAVGKKFHRCLRQVCASYFVRNRHQEQRRRLGPHKANNCHLTIEYWLPFLMKEGHRMMLKIALGNLVLVNMNTYQNLLQF